MGHFTFLYYGSKCGIKMQARHPHKSMIVQKLMPYALLAIIEMEGTEIWQESEMRKFYWP